MKMRWKREMGCPNFRQGLGGDICQIKNGNIYQTNVDAMLSVGTEETKRISGTKQIITGIIIL